MTREHKYVGLCAGIMQVKQGRRSKFETSSSTLHSHAAFSIKTQCKSIKPQDKWNHPQKFNCLVFSPALQLTHSQFIYLIVWSNEALRIWLLSLEKLRQVTPLLCARSNLLRHWPLWIFHTWIGKSRGNIEVVILLQDPRSLNARASMYQFLIPDQLHLLLMELQHYCNCKGTFLVTTRTNTSYKEICTLIFPSCAPVASISVSLLKHMHSTASSIIIKLSCAWYFRS